MDGLSSFPYLALLSSAIKFTSFMLLYCLSLSAIGSLHFQITENFEEVQVQSRGFGILDVGYRSKVTFE